MLEEILPDLDLVLVMTVNPGFGGQHFLAGTLPKIRTIRQMIDSLGTNCELEVDGGIDHETAPLVVEAALACWSPAPRSMALKMAWPPQWIGCATLGASGKGIWPWSGSSPAWIRWCRQAKASPRMPVSRTQSVAVVTEGGLRSIGSVNTTGRTMVQWDKGGVRVESVQQWNGNRPTYILIIVNSMDLDVAGMPDQPRPQEAAQPVMGLSWDDIAASMGFFSRA